MSTSSASNASDLTITVLNRIFDFAAVDAEDAILRLGTVSLQWKDTLLYCPSMWQRLVEQRWPQDPDVIERRRKMLATAGRASKNDLGVDRWSMQSYKMRMATRIRSRSAQDEMAFIAGCDNDNWQFQCPILAQNLKVLQNEVHAGNGLNYLYCDVCEKKITPCTNEADIEDAVSRGQCVSAIFPARTAKAVTETARIASGTSPDPKIDQETILNIAVVVTKSDKAENHSANILRQISYFFSAFSKATPAYFEKLIRKKTEEKVSRDPKLNSSGKARIEVLKELHALDFGLKVFNKSQIDCEFSTGNLFADDVGVPDEVLEYIRLQKAPSSHMEYTSSRFLSRNSLDLFFQSPKTFIKEHTGDESDLGFEQRLLLAQSENSNVALRFRIVYVEPSSLYRSSSASSSSYHPANKGSSSDKDTLGTGPLSNNAMPSNGGWQYIFCADQESSEWFSDPALSGRIETGSAAKALLLSYKVHAARPSVKAGGDEKKKTTKKNLNNNDDSAEESVSSDDDFNGFNFQVFEAPSMSRNIGVFLRNLYVHVHLNTKKRERQHIKRGKRVAPSRRPPVPQSTANNN